ncbi:MAG: DUF4173 domain-containing protein [Anaerolineae bacterium]|nr:DUF4173 domain-containing protein [Anaerolineae bacterium]
MQTADQASTEQDSYRHFLAALVALGSLLMGLIGNLLFYAHPVGINVFLYVAVGLLIAFGLLVYLQRPIVYKHAGFALPAALFALWLGVRLAPPLVMFNLTAMLGSLFVVMHFTGISRFLGGHWLKPVQCLFETAVISWLASLSAVVPDSLHWFKRVDLDNQRLATMRSVLRGLLITLPIVAVFTVLLSSADAVFGDFAEQALSFLLPESAANVIEQIILTGVFTMVALIGFWTMLYDHAPVFEEIAPHLKSHRFHLNIIETSMVLGSVNFLFVAFVMIQARYFFGGEANITAQGYTYAEYARRGFYELLAVSCMTMLLLVALENLTYRKREEENVFRGLVVLMVVLTFVILIAAFQRLNLYENAYGYTRIRVMSGTFMVWLAVLLGVLLIAILRHRREVFWIGCIVTGLPFILTLNLMNMDGFIARHNIARFENTGGIDVPYLLSLSDDAIPTVATLIANPDLDESERDQLLRGLGNRLYELDQDRESRDLFGYHLGKARAWSALNTYRESLQPYIYNLR